MPPARGRGRAGRVVVHADATEMHMGVDAARQYLQAAGVNLLRVRVARREPRPDLGNRLADDADVGHPQAPAGEDVAAADDDFRFRLGGHHGSERCETGGDHDGSNGETGEDDEVAQAVHGALRLATSPEWPGRCVIMTPLRQSAVRPPLHAGPGTGAGHPRSPGVRAPPRYSAATRS